MGDWYCANTVQTSRGTLYSHGGRNTGMTMGARPSERRCLMGGTHTKPPVGAMEYLGLKLGVRVVAHAKEQVRTEAQIVRRARRGAHGKSTEPPCP